MIPTARDSDRMCPASFLPDAFQRIAELATRSRTASAFYRTALTIISEHFQALYAAMSVCNAAESLDEQVTAERAWRDRRPNARAASDSGA